MRLVWRILAFLLAFLLGFAACAGSIVGLGYFAYKNVSLGTFNVDTSGFHNEEMAEVSINYLTIEDLIEEWKTVSEMGDELTFDMLVLRYGLIIPEEVNAVLPDDIRALSLHKVFSEEGLDIIASNIYFGQFFNFEKVESADADVTGNKYIWLDPNTGLEVGGLNANIANYTIKDFLDGGINVEKLLADLTVGDVLDMRERNDLPVYKYDAVNGEILVTDIEPVTVWYDASGHAAGNMMNSIAAMNINEFDAAIDTLTIAELMGYVNYNGKYYNSAVKTGATGDYILITEAAGVASELADVSLATITGGGLQEEIVDIRVSTALGYTEIDGEWYNGDKKVTGVMSVFAKNGYKIGELDSKIKEIQIGELAGLQHLDDGKWYKTVDPENPENNVLASGVLATMADLTVDQITDDDALSAKVKTITVADALGYTKVNDKWYEVYDHPGSAKNEEVTGFMAVIADTPMSDIQTTIDGAETGELLGYTKKSVEIKDGDGNVIGTEERWFDGGVEAHVLMQKVANTPFNEMKNLTDTLTIQDVIPAEQRETGFISLVAPETNITEIGSEVNNMFETKTMRDFIESGAIVFEPKGEQTAEQRKEAFLAKPVADYTMSQLMNFIADLPDAAFPTTP